MLNLDLGQVLFVVDLLDVVSILGDWMTSPDGLPDINGDGMVDLQDLLLVLDAYGPCEL